MIDAAGKPHILDFGLAKREAGEVTVTHDGDVLGTPIYMSPEQVESPHAVDGRSDVYALGVILYELVTGERPFRGNLRMLLHQIKHDDPRPPRSLNDRIPRDLETICLRAMEKAPAKRYATAADLAADLRRWLDGQPITARPVGPVERLVKWVRRKPQTALLAGGSAVLVAVVAGLIGTSAAYRAAVKARDNARTQAGEAEKARGETQNALGKLAVQTERANRLLYNSRMTQVQRHWEQYNPGLFLALLDEQRPENQGGVDRRGFEWHYWQRKFASGHVTFKGHTGRVTSPENRS